MRARKAMWRDIIRKWIRGMAIKREKRVMRRWKRDFGAESRARGVSDFWLLIFVIFANGCTVFAYAGGMRIDVT